MVFGISSSAVKRVTVIWIAVFLDAGVQQLEAGVKYILPPAFLKLRSSLPEIMNDLKSNFFSHIVIETSVVSQAIT